MITTIKLYSKPRDGQMRVIGFMSGSGTNLVNMIEYEKKLDRIRGKSPYHIAAIFSDTYKSKATEIGAKFSLPVLIFDLESYCRSRDKPIKDMFIRSDYELECLKVLQPFECEVAAYAGYMRKATPAFVNAFLGVNVHPADLRITDNEGVPKYRGDHAVRDAIKSGATEIRSSTHLVKNKVDCGQILMVSAPVSIEQPFSEENLNATADDYQKKLKEVGDWEIFPKTLEFLADGRFSHLSGELYFDMKKIPGGVILNGR